MKITRSFLDKRTRYAEGAGYQKQRWIEFCEILLDKGFTLSLYESQGTVSKYIYVKRKGAKQFKVRFSNHKPNRIKEEIKDCDFFVGITHFGVTTTEHALQAVYKHFNVKPESVYERYLRKMQPQEDHATRLKRAFVKAAKMVHPDRASSDSERKRLTALMQKVNAAYRDKDRDTIESIIAEEEECLLNA